MNAPNKFQTKTGRIEELERKLNSLQSAITAHHAQKADDRCIFDDDKLYAAAGLPPCDRRVGSKEAMLANCARFIEKRCEDGGWKSYAELEKELAALKRQLAIGVTCENCGGYLPGHATGACER